MGLAQVPPCGSALKRVASRRAQPVRTHRTRGTCVDCSDQMHVNRAFPAQADCALWTAAGSDVCPSVHGVSSVAPRRAHSRRAEVRSLELRRDPRCAFDDRARACGPPLRSSAKSSGAWKHPQFRQIAPQRSDATGGLCCSDPCHPLPAGATRASLALHPPSAVRMALSHAQRVWSIFYRGVQLALSRKGVVMAWLFCLLVGVAAELRDLSITDIVTESARAPNLIQIQH